MLDNQVVHYTLAELQTEVEALRALVYRATELYVAGKDVTQLASMAKLKAGRLTREVADKCLQYWGGMGFTWENPRLAAVPRRAAGLDRRRRGRSDAVDHQPGSPARCRGARHDRGSASRRGPVQAERRGAFWFVRLNRPDKRNALSQALLEALAGGLRRGGGRSAKRAASCSGVRAGTSAPARISATSSS